MDPKSQVRFAELLRYFQRGTFATFTRVAELALGETIVAEPYFVSNLLFASQICGLCETSIATGSTQWWVAHDADVRINSHSTKLIGATDLWLTDPRTQPFELIADENHRPLIFGSFIDQEAGAAPSIFADNLSSVVPSFSSIDDQLCRVVSMTETHAGPIDLFTPASGRWEAADPSKIEGDVMFRARGPFSGFTYYIQHTQLSLRFQILQPEWAFVAAIHLLPWQFTNLAEVSKDSVCVPRNVRLPTIFTDVYLHPLKAYASDPLCAFSVLARTVSLELRTTSTRRRSTYDTDSSAIV